MFRDVEMKIAFHKERIIKELIKKGIAPDNASVEYRLNNIDANLALFKHEEQLAGKTINITAYNEGLKLLYKDLEFLYGLLYELTIKEFVTLKSFVDTHLDELEDIATMYELKAKEEVNSTALGNTLLFKNNEFNILVENNITHVDLGTVEVNKGSRIACIANINNIEADKVLFGLKKLSDNTVKHIAVYNYNHDSLIIDGNLQTETYETTIKDEQVINGPVVLNIGEPPSNESKYIIMAGKGKILVKTVDEIGYILQEKPSQLNTASFDKRSYIDFYIVGGNKITFRFNKKPLNTNFSLNDYIVTDLKHIHHFFIECEENFAFDFELDKGDVYAVKEDGIIDNDKLLFSRNIEVRDFYIEEYKTGEKEKYNAFLRIVNDDAEPIDIESVSIKELSLLGGID